MPNILAKDLDLETLMDGLVYVLSKDSRTSPVSWILGEVGMGRPAQLPFGYVTMVTETVMWYTANGGTGGLAAGLDDWGVPITLTIAFEPHRFVEPIPAVPSATSPFNPSNNAGEVLAYQEQPGWRKALLLNNSVKEVLRLNPTLSGAATDTRIVESRYLLQNINNELYRVARTSLQAQQRRVRGH